VGANQGIKLDRKVGGLESRLGAKLCNKAWERDGLGVSREKVWGSRERVGERKLGKGNWGKKGWGKMRPKVLGV